MVANRVPIDPHHTGCISNTAPVEDELRNLGFDQRVTGLMGVGSHKSSSAVKAPVALGAGTRSAIAFDVLGLTTMFAGNGF